MSYTFRVTARQSQLLDIGLRPILLAYTNWQHSGQFPAPHPQLTGNLVNDRGGYDEQLMRGVVQLAATLQRMQHRPGRLYLCEYSDITALQLALRLALERLRHGHEKAWAPRLERSAKHLMLRLDALRCRVKRALIARSGHPVFSKVSQQWRAFVHWMRLHLLYCRCKWRIPNATYGIRRRRLDMLCEWAQAGLLNLNEPLPYPRELRRLVRLAVRYIRRDRRPYPLATLVNHPEFAASRLADFIIRRRTKAR